MYRLCRHFVHFRIFAGKIPTHSPITTVLYTMNTRTVRCAVVSWRRKTQELNIVEKHSVSWNDGGVSVHAVSVLRLNRQLDPLPDAHLQNTHRDGHAQKKHRTHRQPRPNISSRLTLLHRKHQSTIIVNTAHMTTFRFVLI